MNEKIPCACTIAGSDSGAGAGIQADLKTFQAVGVWGCSVITSLTAQNPRRVLSVTSPSPEFVGEQLMAVMEDFDIRTFKTGMLPDAGIIEVVSEMIPGYAKLVADPVISATSGARLIDDDAVEAIKSKLMKKTYLLTPNLPEVSMLLDTEIEPEKLNDEKIIEYGLELLKMGPKYVLIKGGHMLGDKSVDYLMSEEYLVTFTAQRYPYDVHGSGCSLSAAITAHLALGNEIEDACRMSKECISRYIRDAYQSASGKYSINPSPSE